MFKKIAILMVLIAVIAGGAWYYFNRIRPVRIDSVLSNPGAYSQKEITLEGEVTDRTAFFAPAKFFKLRDGTGEIIIMTGKNLPEIKAAIRVKGRINQSFALGDRKLLIFSEESSEQKDSGK